MSFSSEKNNQSSDKFFLVYLQPARYVTDSLISIGSNKYTVSFPYTVDKVEESGSVMTKVTNPSSSGEYSILNGVLTIYTTDVTKDYVVFHSLYYTSREYRYIGKIPTTPATDIVEWIPRVSNGDDIQIQTNITNQLEGLASYAQTTVILDNVDKELSQYFGSNDTFYNKTVKLYMCIDSVSNIKLLFEGTVARVNLGNKTISLNLKDSFLAFDSTPTFGDIDDEQYIRSTTAPGATVYNDKVTGLPLTMALGRFVGHGMRSGDGTGLPALTQTRDLDVMIPLNIVDLGGTTNGGLAIRCPDGLADNNGLFTPSSIVYAAGPGLTTLTVTTGEAAKFWIGDIIWVQNGDGSIDNFEVKVVTATTIVVANDATGHASYNHAVGGIRSAPNDSKVNRLAIDTVGAYAVGDNPFARVSTTTAGGNSVITVDLPLLVLGTGGATIAFDPVEHRLVFWCRLKDTRANHADALKLVIDGTGATTNASSFTTAKSGLDEYVNLTIPKVNEKTYSDAKTYITDILKSSFGYLTFNDTREIVYNLWATPSSSDTRGADDIDINSQTYGIEYRDLYNKIEADNTHLTGLLAGQGGSSTTHTVAPLATRYVAEDTKAAYFQGVDKTLRIAHVLEKFDTVGATILTAKQEPLTTYIYKSTGKDLDINPGDDIQLESNLLGLETSKDIKILSTSKSEKGAVIIGSELKGI